MFKAHGQKHLGQGIFIAKSPFPLPFEFDYCEAHEFQKTCHHLQGTPRGQQGQRVLHHLTTKIARREVLGYSQLVLQESAYDNAYLLPLISMGRFFGRSFFLLTINFILQYSVAYLLYTRTNVTQKAYREKLFGLSESQGACYYPEKYEPDIRCTPDEVYLATDWKHLDLNEDNHWTFEEASQLKAEHLGSRVTGRRVNMTEVYKNIIRVFEKYAGPRIALCDTQHQVEVFDQLTGFWEVGYITNITSDNRIIAIYANATKLNVFENRHTRKRLNGVIYTCSFPKCVDTDNGAIDSIGSACQGYNGWDACGGTWDDEDFKVGKLCCTCGGGSRSFGLAGYSHLPVGLSMDRITSVDGYTLCKQDALLPAQQDECIKNFTTIPNHIYMEEIAPFAIFCLLPETETCSNMKLRNLRPHVEFNIQSTVPVFFKITGLSTATDLTPDVICHRAVSLFCPSVFTLQSSLFQEERTDACGKKSRSVQGNDVKVTYQASSVYGDPVFGLTSAMFQGFLFLIVFLWGLASVAEFRSISVWWNVMLALPSCGIHDCLRETWESSEEDCSLEILGISKKIHILTILLNLLPRSILQCCIFIVGIQYLLSVRNISDLILNSLALTFLVTVDEMLFAAFAGEQNAAWIQATKPIKGRSFRFMDRILALTHIPFGMFMFFPILIWLSYYLISNKIYTDQLADATYCLCDLEGSNCLASRTLAM